MSKNLTKTLSLVLAIVMVLGLGAFNVLATETTVNSQEELNSAVAAASNGDIITINNNGTYKIPSFSDKTLTVVGKGDETIIDATGTNAYHGSTLTIKNCKIAGTTGDNYQGLQHITALYYEGCSFTGKQFLYGKTVQFNDCAITGTLNDDYSFWTYGAENVTFNNCAFTSLNNSKSVLCYTEQSISGTATRAFNNCTFNCTGTAEKSAVMINPTAYSNVNTYVVSFTGCTATGYGTNRIESVSGLVGLKTSEQVKDNITITIDNEQVYPVLPKVAQIGTTGYATLADAIAALPTDNKAAPTEATEIKLLADTNGGFDFGNSSGTTAVNAILDLNGHTLTLGPAIGSTGTETNGLRVLAYSKLEIKNGTVTNSDVANEQNKRVAFPLVNYSEMTLTDVTVTPYAQASLAINNRGNLTLKGNTTVNNPTSYNSYSGWPSSTPIAITNDPYNYYYTDVNASVNVADSTVTVGNMMAELYGNNTNSGTVEFNISAGQFGTVYNDGNTARTVSGNITGGTFSSKPDASYIADGYTAKANGEGKYDVLKAESTSHEVHEVTTSEVEAEMTITATTDADVDKTEVRLSSDVVNEMKNNATVNTLTVATDVATVAFNEEAVSQILSNAGDDGVKLVVEDKGTANSDIEGAQEIIDLSFVKLSDNSKVEFNNGEATITVKATVEDPNNPGTVYYNNGYSLVEPQAPKDVTANGYSFTATHFSEYVRIEGTATTETGSYVMYLGGADYTNSGDTYTVPVYLKTDSGTKSVNSFSFEVTGGQYLGLLGVTKIDALGGTVEQNGGKFAWTAGNSALSVDENGVQIATATFSVEPINVDSQASSITLGIPVVKTAGYATAASVTPTNKDVTIYNLKMNLTSLDNSATVDPTTLYFAYGGDALYASITDRASGTAIDLDTGITTSAKTGYRLKTGDNGQNLWKVGDSDVEIPQSNLAGGLSELTNSVNAVLQTVKVWTVTFQVDDPAHGSLPNNPTTKIVVNGAQIGELPIATPEPGWQFDNFTTGENTVVTADTVVNADMTVTANFKEGKYNITLSDTSNKFSMTDTTGIDTDGKVTYSTDPTAKVTFKLANSDTSGETQIKSVTYRVGTAHEVTLTPEDGVYKIPCDVITANVTVAIELQQTVRVEFTRDANGTLDGSTVVYVIKGQTLGTNVPTPTPSANYEFDKWVKVVGDTEEEVTAIDSQEITAAATYKAIFKVKHYLVTDANNVSGKNGQSVPYGTNLVISQTQTAGNTNHYVLSVKYQANGGEVKTAQLDNGVYTIDGTDITGDLTITSVVVTGKFEYITPNQYMALQTNTMIAVLKTDKQMGKVFNLSSYGNMYWSEKYEGYAMIVSVPSGVTGEDEMKSTLTAQLLAQLSLIDGTATEIAYYNNNNNNAGDVNGDGSVNVVDSGIIREALNSGTNLNYSLTKLGRLSLDVNGTKQVNVNDIIIILKTAVGNQVTEADTSDQTGD